MIESWPLGTVEIVPEVSTSGCTLWRGPFVSVPILLGHFLPFTEKHALDSAQKLPLGPGVSRRRISTAFTPLSVIHFPR